MLSGSQRAAPERGFSSRETLPERPETIHVCHIVSGDLWAGAEAQAAILLRALSRRPDLSISAILLNEGEMARRLRSYGIDLRVIPESDHNFLGLFNETARFLRSRQVRILHSHRYKENLLAALLARRCGIPFLVSTRHGAPEPFTGWRHIKHSAIGYLDDLAARYAADRVISVSDELRNHLLRRIPAKKIIIIRNSIDTEHVRSELTKTGAKRHLGIPEHAKVVGYAGRLVPIKRLDIFLHAARHIARADSAVVFVIAGDGPEEARLKALAQELHLEGRTRFLGFRDDIYDVMRAFDVLALCSDHEGLPRTILDALYLGVPVVARAIGGIPEVIKNGLTGILLDSAEPGALANACLLLLKDDERAKRMVAAGTAHMQDSFSSQRTTSEMIEIYRSLGERQ